jgi:hypothetical protein
MIYPKVDWAAMPLHVFTKGERRLEAETYLLEGYWSASTTFAG